MADRRKFLDEALRRHKLAVDYWQPVYDASAEDWRFYAADDQWPESYKALREAEGRPCETFNRLPQFVKQETNEQRQNRPAGKINPVDDTGDPEVAKAIQGVIRHIEVSSSADVADDTSFEGCVVGGIGWQRVRIDYIDDDSFERDILIEPIYDWRSVLIDPFAKRRDRADMRWAFIHTDMPRDEFEDQYPDAEACSIDEWDGIGDDGSGADWLATDKVRVCEYFWTEYEPETICQLQDGSVVPFKDVPEGTPVVNKRSVQRAKIKWAKITAVDVLEETDWEDWQIPIFPVFGEEQWVDGELRIVSLVRNAKSSQRAFNMAWNGMLEAMALSPKSPWMVTPKMVEGFEAIWRTSNTEPHAYLPFNVDPQQPGGPQRTNASVDLNGWAMVVGQAEQALKSTTGIYDASLGAQGNETSGRAILARQKEGDTANFNYVDNLSRCILSRTRALMRLTPIVISAPRVVRIIGADDTRTPVMLYNSQQSQPPDQLPPGVEKIYDIGTGKYDVTVTVGPSYATKRQEAVASMMDAAKFDPLLLQTAGDIFYSQFDWEKAQEIAERRKMALPPQILQQIDAEKSGQEPPTPQQMQLLQQHQQLTEQVQQLTQVNQQLQSAINNKAAENVYEHKLKLQLAKIQQDTALIVKEAEINARLGQAEIQAKLAMNQQLHSQAHEIGMAAHGAAMQPVPGPEGQEEPQQGEQ